jgi:hypothetical protein
LWYGRWNCHPCGLTCGLMRCGAVRYFVSRRIRVFEPKQKPIGRKLSTVLWLSHLVFCCASFAVSDDPLLRWFIRSFSRKKSSPYTVGLFSSLYSNVRSGTHSVEDGCCESSPRWVATEPPEASSYHAVVRLEERYFTLGHKHSHRKPKAVDHKNLRPFPNSWNFFL